MKVNISRENYEEWMIDFIEGNLSADDEREVRNFLSMNPDLKEELEDLEDIVVEPEEEISFDGKVSLKKDTGPVEGLTRNEYLFIQRTEGRLTPAEQREYEVLMRTAAGALKEQNLFDKTKLTADETITYPAKNRLKRVVLLPVFSKEAFNRAAAIAVLILLISVSWFTFRTGTLKPERKMAAVHDVNAGHTKKTPAVEKIVVADAKEVAEVKEEPVQANGTHDEKEVSINEEEAVKLVKKSEKPELAALSGRGLNELMKPVKVNGYEVAVDHIMPLYIALLQAEKDKPEIPTIEVPDEPAANDLLAGGVNVFNKLTGNFINIKKRYNDNGDVVAYSFATPNLRIDHKVKKEE